MGLASMVLCFAIGALSYLGCKIRRDVQRKFLIGDGEDEEDESEYSEGLAQLKQIEEM